MVQKGYEQTNIDFYQVVSIQPKPKNGLEEDLLSDVRMKFIGFNPAEAEEWFRRDLIKIINKYQLCFNPAEAEEWFRSY